MNQNSEKDLLRSWLAFLRTAETVKKDLDSKFRAEFDLSISRFDVLSALDRVGRNGLRSGELSKQLFVSDGNTTQVISKLIAQGLVHRRNDERDARVAIYSLSDEGKDLFDLMAKRHLFWMQSIFAPLSEDEMEALRDILDKLPPKLPTELKDVA